VIPYIYFKSSVINAKDELGNDEGDFSRAKKRESSLLKGRLFRSNDETFEIIVKHYWFPPGSLAALEIRSRILHVSQVRP
jgi:hypothetical protein